MQVYRFQVITSHLDPRCSGPANTPLSLSERAMFIIFYLILRLYDYNLHVESLLPDNLWLVT